MACFFGGWLSHCLEVTCTNRDSAGLCARANHSKTVERERMRRVVHRPGNFFLKSEDQPFLKLYNVVSDVHPGRDFRVELDFYEAKTAN